MTTQHVPAAATDSVVAWRGRLLQAAGFPDTLAQLLAATPGVDIHALLNLVDRGCPPELAVRILGPFAGTRERE
ncbi:hypothetical protein [Crystallibacter crystallopoietes]|uniref:hypothetical protein n=1 Tax=Crystallibacter crystallopoietes TaxID=37928 RepID=UPI0009DB53FB|nr:hypothetical protein [Arthrobacter crystallopoietes]